MTSLKTVASELVAHGLGASEVKRLAEKQFNAARREASRSLKTASYTAQAAGDKLGDGLRSSARYLRRNDANAMAVHMKAAVRRHPGTSLMLALSLGFLLGAAQRKH
jgi:hypothetical protein